MNLLHCAVLTSRHGNISSFWPGKGFFVPECIFAFLLKPEEDPYLNPCSLLVLVDVPASARKVKFPIWGNKFLFFWPRSEVQLWPHLLLSVHLLLPTGGVCFFFLCSRPIWINFCSLPLLRKTRP